MFEERVAPGDSAVRSAGAAAGGRVERRIAELQQEAHGTM